MKKTLLMVLPHCSTGGLPQYALMKIKSLINDCNVYVCEWNNISEEYVVQKNEIKKLLPESHFLTCPQDTVESVKNTEFMKFVKNINPDIIHLEEFPEGFLPVFVIRYLYSINRTWKVVETTHDSNFTVEKKKTRPDLFIFPSNFHVENFKYFGIPTQLLKYDLPKKDRPYRPAALKELGLDNSYIHILNVGLFTPGKNQGEIFEIAKRCLDYKILFHFIGNQAQNFESYWKPLVKDLPANCRLWGERNDVDKFYSCMDLLLFPSKNELLPLVPIEALSWNMPVMMRKLPIYNGEFENEVEWIDENIDNTIFKILIKFDLLNMPKVKLVHLLTRPEDEREVKSVNSLKPLENYNIEYVQHINKPCTEYPENLPALQVHSEKKPGYYGAYSSFRKAFETEFSPDLDLLLVCECDCILDVGYFDFIKHIIYAAKTIKQHGIDYFSFAYNNWSPNIENIDDKSYITNKIIMANCVVMPQSSKNFLLKQYKNLPWDSPDLWLDYCFKDKKKAVLHKPIAKQHAGYSLIDNVIKSGEIYVDDLTYNFTNIDGPKIELLSGNPKKHLVEFINNGKCEYSINLPIGHWAKAYKKYFIPWKIKIDGIDKYNLNLKGKSILISFESKSLGDTLAWIPYVEEFRKIHGCKVFCSTFWNEILDYENIIFVKPGTIVNNIFGKYTIGCFSSEELRPSDWRIIPLQKIASDILGVEYKEIKPNINIPKGISNIEQPYICIGVHSTAQCKYWNNPTGWQEIVDYYVDKGYKVVLISKERDNYMGNKNPINIIDKSGDISINDRIIDLKYAKCFIGIGSGLSWLSWVVGTPTTLISGFSKEFCEFTTNSQRVINKDVCNGCFNDDGIEFDKGSWNWCPRNNNFECSKSITSDMVIGATNKLLNGDK